MVPVAKILETAKREGVDLIGLSGLITPSLEEMTVVATEMERQGFTTPLLIGGATTSKAHTAVKIAPCYSHPVIHVLDASRAVGVAGSLLSDTLKTELVRQVSAEYAGIRTERAGRTSTERRLTIANARANPQTIDLRASVPTPDFLGVRAFEQYPLAELVPWIDWTPFFQTWELAGHYPAILTDPTVGKAARDLFEEARTLLDRIVSENLLRAHAVVGFFPANAIGDDIDLYSDPTRTGTIGRIHTLRQQHLKSGGKPNLALADFVAPAASGVLDYVGAFAVTTGIGLDQLVADFERDHDDYRSIMAKALADRLAEAFAERMHARVRREFWGYARDEKLANEDVIKEKYQGLRPAPGYPACPDHTEKGFLFSLLDASRLAGIDLTENYAMTPTAAVSGYYFWRPEAQYFGVGKVDRDQVADYAARKGWSMPEAERWLAPNLGYDRR